MRRIKVLASALAHRCVMSNRPLILLLVEDEPLREALRFSLETEGYAVSARADGRAVAAVVIDDDAADWPDLGERPTIVLTGDVERFLRRGVRGVSIVEKPLLGDVLGERLGQVLNRPLQKPCHPGRSA
ncbi:nucleoside transporter [Caulobacter sp. 1776]|uniref:oxygen-responsive sensory/signaling system negative regulator FixT n=1 Tax=Caulobacter sp. 1776 TaxID=3156420 RepID=UPI003399EDB7